MNLRDIVARVNEWADWSVRLQSSGLGYPSCTAEARAHAGGRRPPGPRVPHIAMNPRAVEVDRAIRNMPAEMAALIKHKHVDGTGTALELAREYAASAEMSLSTYYRVEKDAYWFIGGCLSAMRQDA